MALDVTERSNPLMSNRRLAAVLLSIALTFFLGIVLKYWILG
ncbi:MULTISPECIES: cytochrome oxidase small assembly protein [unclassified Polynucleobacter]|nr:MULTISPECIES: cytochrome oxidase small assembly protein [unclassified Polynucleobacter]